MSFYLKGYIISKKNKQTKNEHQHPWSSVLLLYGTHGFSAEPHPPQKKKCQIWKSPTHGLLQDTNGPIRRLSLSEPGEFDQNAG